MAEEKITRVQYAPYLEKIHQEIIERIRPIAFDTTAINNPFAMFTPWDLDTLYLDPAVRDSGIETLPTLFDLYNDHVLNLDLMSMYSDALAQSLNVRVPGTSTRVIDAQVAARRDWLLDEFDSKISPRLSAGFRDINAVQSSQFVVARAIALRDHTRQLNDFAAQLTMRFAEFGHQVWEHTLAWHEKVPSVYGQALAAYTAQRIDIEKHVFELSAKCCLWPQTVFGYLATMLSAIEGATTTSSSVAGESPGSTGGGRLGGAIGGALSGATAGSVIPGIGTGIGAVIGAVGGLFG